MVPYAARRTARRVRRHGPAVWEDPHAAVRRTRRSQRDALNHRDENDSIDHVLSAFSADELKALPQIIDAVADGIERWLDDGTDAAMQFVNNLEVL
jgi:hypothetical protein